MSVSRAVCHKSDIVGVGKGALAPCPPSLSVAKDTWARFALPTLRHGSSHTFGVIARLDRAIQYSERAVVERRSRGVLDSPPSRGMTALLGERAIASCSVIARSPCDEAIQSPSAERFWIASAFAEASADKSLRSQ